MLVKRKAVGRESQKVPLPAVGVAAEHQVGAALLQQERVRRVGQEHAVCVRLLGEQPARVGLVAQTVLHTRDFQLYAAHSQPGALVQKQTRAEALNFPSERFARAVKAHVVIVAGHGEDGRVAQRVPEG